ncbi:sigma-70 family RNA polymerase sigma factor [Microbacterium sp. ASV49]|uniref:Sigma-70 family RNA polymerase sigma factor n=1 Tax=Microbacterium candidum TaxID=3041922 RepID=A0ABT7MTS9_9MICO|nr:sigma-70 family RNA polymerase sigma factor [Microbacterium sp. ASV49]MDL9977852.1 sigma-70 family RNA polymerase sigma factor [Microbacterium sp. ASV49]
MCSLRDRLIVDNLPLVGHLAAKLHARATHVNRDDLLGAGALALVLAADAFDPELGVPFGAYARQRIVGSFADEMRAMDWASRGIRRRAKEATAARDSLAQKLGRVPTAEEIAAALGLTAAGVAESLADAGRIVMAIDDPFAQSVPAMQAAPDEEAERAEYSDLLGRAVAALPERMRFIILAVYFEDRAIKDIAAELGVTHSAVSQQRTQAVRLLRDAMDRHFSDQPGVPPAAGMRGSVRDAYFRRIAGSSRRFAGTFLPASTGV